MFTFAPEKTNSIMKQRFFLYLTLCLTCLLPQSIWAQNSDEKVVEFLSDNATMEDNPNKQNYNITIFSPDGQWKMQLNYYSDSMFGTFSNDDFRLSGDGKYYNYVRNPKNDMVFYSFTDMNVTVTDEGTLYRVKANCLTNNKTRFIVEATIEAPQPQSTVTDDLGYARVQPNTFYGTYNIYAENDNYKLAYGVVSESLTGNFYRADMLMPELYDKKSDKSITILTASAVHTQEGDNTIMKAELLSDDHVLYILTMYNGPYEMPIVEEKDIDLENCFVQDLTEMYGCYQFAGQNKDYQFALAVKPEVLESGKTEWNKDDMLLQYTNLLLAADESFVDIFDIKATLERSEKLITLKADLTSMEGILYHINMPMDQGGYMPEAKDTVNIDFGHVAMVDYSQGMGIVGFIAVKPGEYQMRAYLYASKLEGEFVTDDFITDACDIMVISDNSYVFHDGKYANATMTKDEQNRTIITLDMLAVDETLYHATMYLDDLNCLKDSTYNISNDNGITMVAIQDGEDNSYHEYTLQFQDMEGVTEGEVGYDGNGYCFSFYFAHNGTGIGGEYGYSAGTLADDEIHTFVENGCEVRIGPVAGTLTVEPKQRLMIEVGGYYLRTYLYSTSFKFMGQNGAIYTGEGENFLICIDTEGYLVDITRDIVDSINEQLAEQGLKVRKVLKDGKIIVEKDGHEYDMQGRTRK